LTEEPTETEASPARKPRRRRLLLGGIVLLLVLLVAGAALLDHWLPYMLISHYRFAVPSIEEVQRRHGLRPEPVEFKTSDGVEIRGWFLAAKAPAGSESPTMIVLHTLGRTRAEMLEFSLPFREKGFNLALIDMRGHGESGGEYFTFGYHEWRDVVGLLDWLGRRSDGAGRRVCILGASAGGAVALAAARRDRRIRAAAVIATFADFEEVVRYRSPWLPEFWRQRGLRKAERLAGFKVSEVSPLKDVARMKCPLFVAHGEADEHAPYEYGKKLHAAATGRKQFYTIEGADHVNMFARGGEKLKTAIYEFLAESVRPETEKPVEPTP
jgi:dipeptidyl aminopeptidase/acylaminoacyl peptidase